MHTIYYARHFDVEGRTLRYRMFQCEDDHAAIQRISTEPMLAGCASVEISTERKCIWRGEADGFRDKAFAEERAISPAETGPPTP
jgi:hypothetical protein